MFRHKERKESNGSRNERRKQEKGSLCGPQTGLLRRMGKKGEEIKEVKGCALSLSRIPVHSLGEAVDRAVVITFL